MEIPKFSDEQQPWVSRTAHEGVRTPAAMRSRCNVKPIKKAAA
jgi:hypothetical protein